MVGRGFLSGILILLAFSKISSLERARTTGPLMSEEATSKALAMTSRMFTFDAGLLLHFT